MPPTLPDASGVTELADPIRVWASAAVGTTAKEYDQRQRGNPKPVDCPCDRDHNTSPQVVMRNGRPSLGGRK